MRPRFRCSRGHARKNSRCCAAPAHPIVLVESLKNLPDVVAPDMARLGVMLAYAPVHHLLFHAAGGAPRSMRAANSLLVATSANPGGEPLVTDNEEAHEKLARIADLIVTHDRDIVVRADDSVMQIVDGAPAFLRRARGFVPEPIDLGDDGPCVLACGGHLKATLTLTRGREAFVCQHVGDLSDAETFRFYRESAEHLLRLLDVTPEACACDLHPDYLSTRFAEESGAPVLALSASRRPCRGGRRRTWRKRRSVRRGARRPWPWPETNAGGNWGGEALRLDGRGGFFRAGHLAPLALLGGDRAAREPLRMGLAAFAALGRLDEAAAFFRGASPEAADLAARIFAARPAPMTTSLGRLFDAASALLGFAQRQDFEGQAAMRLEALVSRPRALENGFALRDGVVDFSALLAHFIDARPDAREGAELLHGTLIAGLGAWLASLARPGEKIALGGGCLMNKVLAEGLAGHVARKRFRAAAGAKNPAQ